MRIHQVSPMGRSAPGDGSQRRSINESTASRGHGAPHVRAEPILDCRVSAAPCSHFSDLGPLVRQTDAGRGIDAGQIRRASHRPAKLPSPYPGAHARPSGGARPAQRRVVSLRALPATGAPPPAAPALVTTHAPSGWNTCRSRPWRSGRFRRRLDCARDACRQRAALDTGDLPCVNRLCACPESRGVTLPLRAASLEVEQLAQLAERAAGGLQQVARSAERAAHELAHELQRVR